MPLLWLSLAFLVGSIIADNAVLPTTTWLILAGVSLGLVLVIFIVLALIQVGPPLLTLTLGGLRYQLSLPDFNDPHFITPPNNTGERVTITGVVDSFPDLRDNYLYLRIQTEDIRPYGTTTQREHLYGLLLVRLDPETLYHYCDRLQLHGFLETPPEAEDFSYREYLARQGINSYVGSARATLIETNQGNPFWAAIYSLKEKALRTVYQL